MSYIQGTNPSFSQAVISFWFKVPQVALDTAQKEEDDWWDAHGRDEDANPPPLLGLVPLVVFGKEGTTRVSPNTKGEDAGETTSTSVTTCVEYAGDSFDGFTLNMWAWSECTGPTTVEHPIPKVNFTDSPKPGKPINPSYIALDGSGDLRINFESTQTGESTLAHGILSSTGKYTTQETINECWTFQNLGYCGEYSATTTLLGGFGGLLEIVLTLVGWRLLTAVADYYVDQGSSPRVDHKAEQTFGALTGDVGTGSISATPTNVTADRWHHVLISVDMSDGSAAKGYGFGQGGNFQEYINRITQTSTIYVAVDDVNYKDISNLYPNSNKVASSSAIMTAFSSQAARYDEDSKSYVPVGPIPSYSLSGMSVPSGDIGMPAPGKYVDHVYHCEMAEFQMFVGKTLKTDEEANRRAFLDFKRDANGNAVPDNDGKARLKPVNPAVAEKLLNRPPILMHGSNKWIKGTNLGSGGAFTPTGEIKKYKPDPAILPKASTQAVTIP